jgi:type VII secretion protein EccE
MTLSAADNLTALRARSAEVPLRDTAQIVGRRLADHLREMGLSTALVAEAAAPLAGGGREKWRAVREDDEFVSAYAVRVDDAFADRLADIWSQPTVQKWTAVEFSGTSTHPIVSALCAVRSAEAPSAVPVAGLVPQPGMQRPLLRALAPASTDRLNIPTVPVPPGLLESAGWPVGGRSLVEHEGAHEAGHPA